MEQGKTKAIGVVTPEVIRVAIRTCVNDSLERANSLVRAILVSHYGENVTIPLADKIQDEILGLRDFEN